MFIYKTQLSFKTLIFRTVGQVEVGARSGLGPIWAHMGPYGPIYGPIWAHVGPYGPIWAHMGPIWVLLDRSGHDQIRTFGPIWYVSGPEMVF